MTMSEWYCEYELNADAMGADTFAGNLTQGVVDDLLDDLELSEEEWWNKHGTPSRKDKV